MTAQHIIEDFTALHSSSSTTYLQCAIGRRRIVVEGVADSEPGVDNDLWLLPELDAMLGVVCPFELAVQDEVFHLMGNSKPYSRGKLDYKEACVLS